MQKQKLDPESLTVETFEASDYPPVAALDTGECPSTYQTTGIWVCAADCAEASLLC
jgi:hypothetical protein